MSFFAELVEKLGRDNESERRKAACRNLAAGLFIGACIGVTAGVLFAPRSGQETRKEIAGKTADTVEQLREKVTEYINELQARLEAAELNKEDYEEISVNGQTEEA
jgi:gas vesicle protein